jgi:hypothetical protein
MSKSIADMMPSPKRLHGRALDHDQLVESVDQRIRRRHRRASVGHLVEQSLLALAQPERFGRLRRLRLRKFHLAEYGAGDQSGDMPPISLQICFQLHPFSRLMPSIFSLSSARVMDDLLSLAGGFPAFCRRHHRNGNTEQLPCHSKLPRGWPLPTASKQARLTSAD